MTTQVLQAIEDQIEYLNKRNIYPSINLIGGEPTVNLSKFQYYLFWAMNLYRMGSVSSVEMTTNGWWLDKPETAKRFFSIVADATNGEVGLDEGFTARISDDQYHSEWRKDGRKLSSRDLEQWWEPWLYGIEPIFYEPGDYMCNECGEWFESDDMPDSHECPECEDGYLDMIYEEDWGYPMLEKPSDINPWIYIEDQDKYGGPIPTGRAGTNGLGKDNRWRSCSTGILSYKPDGTLNDVCCKGSDLPVGDCWDNPLTLMLLAVDYYHDVEPMCSSCNTLSVAWAKEKGLIRKAVMHKAVTEWDAENDMENPYLPTGNKDMVYS